MRFDPPTRAGDHRVRKYGEGDREGHSCPASTTLASRWCASPPWNRYGQMEDVFQAAGRETPANVPDLERMLDEHASGLDAVYIATPHVLHFSQAKACLEAGLDVLVEKPMVMNAQEARGAHRSP